MKILLVILVAISAAYAKTKAVDVEMTFKVEKKYATDIIFVVDNSGSMQNYHNEIIKNVDTIFNKLKNIHYRISIITTDINDKYSEEFISSGDLTPKKDFQKKLRSIGTMGDAYEKHFDSLLAYSQSNAFSKFKRSDVPLEIIFFSDEDDKESQVTGNYLLSELYKKIDTINMNGIFPLSNERACNTWTELPRNLIELVYSESRRVDLCNLDKLTENLDLLFEIITDGSSSGDDATYALPFIEYKLLEGVDIDTIEVSFGSQIIPRGVEDKGWVFNESTNTIKLGQQIKLINQPSGTLFKIKYTYDK